ncbi:ATP-dependent helicase HrpB, partial|nr:ATP-dependent helicase HrpB [Escherichia coli]
LGGDDVDLDTRVERFRRDRGGRSADMRRLAEGWARIAGGGPDAGPIPAGPPLALAYPDGVARARGRDGEFVMASGRAGRLDPASPLARQTYLVVADLVGSAGNARILAAAAIDGPEIEALFADRLESRTEITFEPQAAALRAPSRR